MKSKTFTIDNIVIPITNENKILFPQTKITKKEVLNYYKDIASLALPYYENRPLTMERCPDGINHQIFIQKNAPSYLPEWIDTWELKKKEGSISHILVNKAATFIYLANQACIAFHLGLSKVDKINYPDCVIFDLDPSQEDIILLKKVVERVRNLMKELGLNPYIKTTGSRGFHIYVPLDRTMSFEKVHDFAKTCAVYLAQKYPKEITVEQSKKKRGGKIFLDYMRNGYAVNAIGPYSLRAKEGAPIATPIHWEELEDKNLHSQSFNIKNIFKRLSKIQDPWKDMLSHPQSLKSI